MIDTKCSVCGEPLISFEPNEAEEPICQWCKPENVDADDIRRVKNIVNAIRQVKETKEAKRERRQEIVVLAICAAFGVWSALAWLVGSVHMAQYLRMGR